jgi:cyclic pyranopterin phosphate synthase
MIDPFGRKITYLRVSVTDRCDFRCFYCMTEEMTFLPRKDVLSLEELDRMISAFIGLGVGKVRLTGGEPLVRKNILSLVRNLCRYKDAGLLDEVTLTTNGSQLDKYAAGLAAAGMERVNVSLDSLNSETFKAITRGGRLARVLDGIEAAKDAGLKVKINAVALRDINEGEFEALTRWCGDQGFDLTFIETMPLGDIGQKRTEHYLPLTQVRDRLGRVFTLTDVEDSTGGPSRYVRVAETGRRIGFITPLTNSFCAACNRMRLTCTGALFMCLGHDEQADLRTPLRAGEGDEALIRTIEEALSRKPKAHNFTIAPGETNNLFPRHMNVTGG